MSNPHPLKHLEACEELPRSSQQWVSEPRAIVSRENITHSKAIPTKKESLLFQLREFGGLQLLFGLNASRLCPCTLGWCRSCRDAKVFNVIGLFVHCEPQTKKKSQRPPNHPKSKTQFKSKSKHTKSNFFFVKPWLFAPRFAVLCGWWSSLIHQQRSYRWHAALQASNPSRARRDGDVEMWQNELG